MSRAADAMPISPGQREALEVLARSGTAPFREVRRAQALLMAADGLPNVQIAAAVGVTAVTVRAWRTRFAEEGLAKFAQVREGRGAQAVDSRGDRGRDRAGDVARDAAGGDALVHPHDGGPGRSQPGHRAPGLAGPRAATASGGDVQAVERSAVRGETRRRGRPVPEPAGQRPWCSAWMRKARYRRWTAPSR